MEHDWLNNEDLRTKEIHKQTSSLLSRKPFLLPDDAKFLVLRKYASNHLRLTLKDGWEERFNQNHGESASDLMIDHLALALANGDKKDLNQITKYLNDKTLRNEQPHVIYGLLGRAKDKDERHTFIAARSFSSLILQKVGDASLRTARIGAFALFAAIVLPHVLPGAVALGTIHLVGSTHLIERGAKLGDFAAKFDQMENKELKKLEDLKQTMVAPLGYKYRGPVTSDQGEMDKRGNDSFNEMRTALRSMERDQRKQLIGLSLLHLRTFIDDYEIIQKEKPDVSSKEHFDQVMKKYAVAFKDELNTDSLMLTQNILTAGVMGAFALPETGEHELAKIAIEAGNDIARDKIDEITSSQIIKAENGLASGVIKMVSMADLPSDFSRAGQVPDASFVISRLENKKRSEQKSSKPSARPTA